MRVKYQEAIVKGAVYTRTYSAEGEIGIENKLELILVVVI